MRTTDSYRWPVTGGQLQLVVCLLLTATVLTVYWPVRHFDFVACDDNIYITENQHVRQGLTGQNIVWAFTTADTTNWHPLTWLSLLADSSLYGLYAGGYHLTSVLLHLANSLLLFFLLRKMTGAAVKSAFVAAMFALHPINVESVAWVSERKNVLSAFFWFATLWAYTGYAVHPGRRRYLIVVLLFAAGLMAKPMLVILPVVLLLIDYWPLRRFSAGEADEGKIPPHPPLEKGGWGDFQVEGSSKRGAALRLVGEKIPLLLLSVISASVTLYIADRGGAVKSLTAFPLGGRIANALVSYGGYLEKMVWPANLAFFYPWREVISPGQVILSVSLIAGITAFVLWGARRWPYLPVGWLWYIMTLAPVIGIVQVGYQAMADRYAYVPLIGIFIMVAWGIPDLISRFSRHREIFAFLSAGLIAVLVVVSCFQVSHWQNSEKLFRHALQVTHDNHLAQNGMGYFYLVRGNHERAAFHFREALRIRPDYADARNNLGIVYMKQGIFEEAIAQYHRALEISPGNVKALNNLGVALACRGCYEEAVGRFREALRLDPGYREARNNLAKAEGELERSVRRQER